MWNKSLILSIWLRNTTLLCVFLEDYTSVVTAKTKGIGQGSVDFALLGLVEREVQVVVDVLVVVAFRMVDSRRFWMARMLAMASTAPAAPSK